MSNFLTFKDKFDFGNSLLASSGIKWSAKLSEEAY